MPRIKSRQKRRATKKQKTTMAKKEGRLEEGVKGNKSMLINNQMKMQTSVKVNDRVSDFQTEHKSSK